MDAWSAGQRLREMIPAIKTFGKAIMSITVNFGSLQNHLGTSTASAPHPPIWVAARDPNSHELLQNGCNQVTPLHLGDEEVEKLMGISMQLVKSSMKFNVLKLCCSAIPMWQIVRKMLNWQQMKSILL